MLDILNRDSEEINLKNNIGIYDQSCSEPKYHFTRQLPTINT